jgi:hypothetical protein
MTDVRRDLRHLISRWTSDSRGSFASTLHDFEEHAWCIAERVIAGIADSEQNSLANINAEREKLDADKRTVQAHAETTAGIITLNVGGKLYVTSVPTLLRCAESLFVTLLSGWNAGRVLSSGTIFIDRDGENFKHILSYLRTGTLLVAEKGYNPSVTLLRDLKREFQHFNIEILWETPLLVSHTRYVFGGMDAEQKSRGDVEIQKSAQHDVPGQWTLDSVHPESKCHTASCNVYDKIIVTGGLHMVSASSLRPLFSRTGLMRPDPISDAVHCYDLSEREWSDGPNLPRPLCDHVQLNMGGSVYVMGGLTSGRFGVEETVQSMYVLDETHPSWEPLCDLPIPIRSFAACVFDEKIFVFGGLDRNDTPCSNVYRYDPRLDLWQRMEDMPISLHEHTVTASNLHCYIVGGRTTNNSSPVVSRAVYKFSIFEARYHWKQLSPLPQARASHASFMWRQQLCVLGGYTLHPNGERTACRKAELLDVRFSANSWDFIDDFGGEFDRCRFGTCVIEHQDRENAFDHLISMAKDRRTSLAVGLFY